jgi:hypothetical protein
VGDIPVTVFVLSTNTNALALETKALLHA